MSSPPESYCSGCGNVYGACECWSEEPVCRFCQREDRHCKCDHIEIINRCESEGHLIVPELGECLCGEEKR